jgi:hypothetical protein
MGVGSGSGDRLTHLGIGGDILQAVIVEDPKLTTTESRGNSFRYLGFGFDHCRTALFDLGNHLLFGGDSLGASTLCLGSRNPRIGFSLIRL